MADRAEATLAEALMASEGGEPGSEDAARQLRGVALDVRVHAQLARYHSAKRKAAEALAFFYATGDLDSLLAARPGVEAALVAWQRLVALTDGVYHDDLIFGTPGEQRGHWKDYLVYAERDVARVDEVERVFRRYGLFDYAFDFGAAQTGRRSTPPMPYLDDYAVERRFTAVGPKSVYEDTVGWGWAGTYGKSARETPAPGGGTLRAAVPNPKDLPREPLYSDFVLRHPAANYDNATFFVDVPDGDYEVVVILADRSAQPVDHGPMTVIFQGGTELGPVSVPAGDIVELRQRVAVACGRLELELNAPPQGDWLLTGLTVTRVAPHFGHRPPRCLRPGEQWDLQATVTSPEALRRASVFYRFTPDGQFVRLALDLIESLGGEEGSGDGVGGGRFAACVTVPATGGCWSTSWRRPTLGERARRGRRRAA